MIIDITDNLSNRIIRLANEYDDMIEHEANDFHDIGDDCIEIVCRIAEIIKLKNESI